MPGLVRGGQDEEFAGFAREASPQLLTTAWLLTGDSRTAEELTREALQRAHHDWSRIRSGQPLAHTRRVMARTFVRARPSNCDGVGVAVVRALQQLPPQERQAVVWRYYLDQSEERTAEELGVTPATVTSAASRGRATVWELLAEEGEPAARTDDLRQVLSSAAVQAPPMHLGPETVVAGARTRRRRRTWRAVGGLAAGVVVTLVVVLGVAGPLDELGSPSDPASVPQWDATRDFRFELGEGTYPRVEVVREAGSDRFTVTSTISGATELDGTAVAGLPGTELFVGPGVNVLLTPAPRGLEPGAHYWLPSSTDLGGVAIYGTSRVVDHGSHALLLQVLVSRFPLQAEEVGDIAWVVDDTVGLASGAAVHQSELESGSQRLLVWRSPEQDLVGYVTRDRGPRLWAVELDREHLYGVAVREDGEVPAETSRQWRFAVLPAGTRDVTAVLDDSVGTVMPFETVPLGSETLAYRLLNGVDVQRGPAGHWSLSWVDADGTRRDLAEPAAGEGAQAPASVPTWDPTADFAVELAPVATGLNAPVLVRIEPGAERFSVALGQPDGPRPLEPVPGELPGQAVLFSDGESISVLLTPVPADVDLGDTHLLAALRGRGEWDAVIAQDGGQRGLAHVLRTDVPVRAGEIQDVLWVTGGEVVAASGTPVLRRDVEGVGEDGHAFVVPKHDVAGVLLPWSPYPLQVTDAAPPSLHSLAVGSVGPGRTDDARLLLALLPEGASDPRVRLDDRDGTVVPLEAAPLGEYTVASTVVEGLDLAVEDDQPALSWTSADGARRSLADAALGSTP